MDEGSAREDLPSEHSNSKGHALPLSIELSPRPLHLNMITQQEPKPPKLGETRNIQHPLCIVEFIIP